MKEIFYDWGGANLWLFQAINGRHNEVSDALMRLGSELGDHSRFPVYLALGAVLGLFAVARANHDGRGTALRWLGAIAVFSCAYALEDVIVGALKNGLDFPRPPAVLAADAPHIVGTPEYRNSFPSGHSVFAITLAAASWVLLDWRARIGAAALVLWVGISRLSLGAHFPADVLGGYLVGLATVVPLAWASSVFIRRQGPGIIPAS